MAELVDAHGSGPCGGNTVGVRVSPKAQLIYSIFMKIEYEATYYDVDKDIIRARLNKLKAKLKKPEFLQKRTVFNMVDGYDNRRWLRIRNEGDKITMSFKQVGEHRIESQKEEELIINNYDQGVEFLKALGHQEKAYQETKRELWLLDGVEVCIDEWPWLKPFIEVEGKNKEEVKRVSKQLGLNYDDAIFDSVDYIYHKKYKVSREDVNNNTPRITFDTPNPFIK